MSILTDADYTEWRASYSKHGMMNEAMARTAFKAAEAAVIAKLATVGVEPVLVTSKLGELCTFSSLSVNKGDKLVPVEALAAARAQALEEAANRMEGPNNNHGAVIRALIGVNK